MENEMNQKTIWAIGHSTRTLEELIEVLQSFKIKAVADIRSYPGSRRYPHFNKEALEVSLPSNNVLYFHIKDLGGRRKTNTDSKNTAWHHPAFRGYADYMETDLFKEGIQALEKIAMQQRTAYMCSEALWWRCHRSMVSDFLKVEGWKVMHIMGIRKEEEHRFTAPAGIIDGVLSYVEDKKKDES
ncbi:MAG: DUF488 domain-containing protein [Bacteroidota bacterium]|nr:DUF488 domain-containing protein [Bacteroidota bacterium]